MCMFIFSSCHHGSETSRIFSTGPLKIAQRTTFVFIIVFDFVFKIALSGSYSGSVRPSVNFSHCNSSEATVRLYLDTKL